MRLALCALLAACHAEAAPPAPEVVAKHLVDAYAFEAYPQWSGGHPEIACPAALADLVPFVHGAVAKDPWGHRYEMFCGSNLPRGAHGFAVRSLGPDGKADTADDIRSW